MKNSISASEAMMKQQCALPHLYWALVMFAVLYASGVVYLAYDRNWPVLVLWLISLPSARWLSLRLSPFTSKWRGQGSVKDTLPSAVSKAHVEVSFYSHNGCPFCPIVARRLDALRKEMDFALRTIDLTLKPKLAESKGIGSVPVVEVGQDRLVGNATTEQLAQLIANAQT